MYQSGLRSLKAGHPVLVLIAIFILGIVSSTAWASRLMLETSEDSILVTYKDKFGNFQIKNKINQNLSLEELKLSFNPTTQRLEIESNNHCDLDTIQTNSNITLALNGDIRIPHILNFGNLILDGIENKIGTLYNADTCHLKNATTFESVDNNGGTLFAYKGQHHLGTYYNTGELIFDSGDVHVTYATIKGQGWTISKKAYLKVKDLAHGSALDMGRFQLSKGQFEIKRKSNLEKFIQHLQEDNDISSGVQITVNNQIIEAISKDTKTSKTSRKQNSNRNTSSQATLKLPKWDVFETELSKMKTRNGSSLAPRSGQTKALKEAYANSKDRSEFLSKIKTLAQNKTIIWRHYYAIEKCFPQNNSFGKTTRSKKPSHFKTEFAKIAKENRDYILKKKKKNWKKLKIDETIKNSKKYTHEKISNLKCKTNVYKTKISVTGEDTLVAAINLLKISKCQYVAVLNFANRKRKGGGYLQGATGQEESLCRRTTLYPVLDHHDKKKNDYRRFKHNELIYTKDVIIFRDTKPNFEHFDENQRVKIDVITQAGYDLRPNRGNETFNKENMKEKIRAQLRIAASNGVDGLVLGPIGCGAFDPQKIMAPKITKCYKKVLHEPEFQGVFKEIRFATNSTKGDNYKNFITLEDLNSR